MNSIKKERLAKRLLSAPNETFGVTYPTMRKYIDNESYPAELCMTIERVTQGEYTAVSLRPDLFTATPAIIMLMKCCVDNFTKYMKDDKYELIIATLNYFENQLPSLYLEALDEIKKLEGGESFVNQRVARKEYEV